MDGLVGEKGDSTLGSWSSPLPLDIAWGATEASLSRLSCLTQMTAELTKGTVRLVPAGCLVPRRLDKSFSPQFDQRLRGFLFIGEKKNCCLTTTSPIDLTPPVSLCCFSLLKGTSLPTLPFSMASFPSLSPDSVALEKCADLLHCSYIFSDLGLTPILSQEACLYLPLITAAIYTDGVLKPFPISPGNQILQICLRAAGSW